MNSSVDNPVEEYESYLYGDREILEFKRAQKISNMIEIFAALSFYVAGVGLIGVVWNVGSYPMTYLANRFAIFSNVNLYTGAAPPSEIRNFVGILVIASVLTVGLLKVSSSFGDIAKSSGITEENLPLVFLSRGVDESRNGEMEEALSQLNNFNELDDTGVPSKMKDLVEDYIEYINSRSDSGYFVETYEDVIYLLMEEIIDRKPTRMSYLDMIAHPDNSNFWLEEDRGEIAVRSVSYLGIIVRSLAGLKPSGTPVPFWILYFIAAGVGVAVFFLVNNTFRTGHNHNPTDSSANL